MDSVPNSTKFKSFRVGDTALKASKAIDRKAKMPGVNAALIHS